MIRKIGIVSAVIYFLTLFSNVKTVYGVCPTYSACKSTCDSKGGLFTGDNACYYFLPNVTSWISALNNCKADTLDSFGSSAVSATLGRFGSTPIDTFLQTVQSAWVGVVNNCPGSTVQSDFYVVMNMEQLVRPLAMANMGSITTSFQTVPNQSCAYYANGTLFNDNCDTIVNGVSGSICQAQCDGCPNPTTISDNSSCKFATKTTQNPIQSCFSNCLSMGQYGMISNKRCIKFYSTSNTMNWTTCMNKCNLNGIQINLGVNGQLGHLDSCSLYDNITKYAAANNKSYWLSYRSFSLMTTNPNDFKAYNLQLQIVGLFPSQFYAATTLIPINEMSCLFINGSGIYNDRCLDGHYYICEFYCDPTAPGSNSSSSSDCVTMKTTSSSAMTTTLQTIPLSTTKLIAQTTSSSPNSLLTTSTSSSSSSTFSSTVLSTSTLPIITSSTMPSTKSSLSSTTKLFASSSEQSLALSSSLISTARLLTNSTLLNVQMSLISSTAATKKLISSTNNKDYNTQTTSKTIIQLQTFSNYKSNVLTSEKQTSKQALNITSTSNDGNIYSTAMTSFYDEINFTTSQTKFQSEFYLSSILPGNVSSTINTTCIVGHWAEYSQCSQTCGSSSTKSRTRPLISEGKYCSKKLSEIEKCDVPPCNPMSVTLKNVAMVLQTLGCIWLIGCCISSFIFSMMFWSSNVQRFLHASQELTLTFVHLFIALARNETRNKLICTLASIIIQFGFVVNFACLMLEAVHVYSLLTAVVSADSLFNKKTNFSIGWVAPFLIVSFTAITSYDHYRSVFSCWLNLGHTISCATYIPILFCTSLGMIVLEASQQFGLPDVCLLGENQLQTTRICQKGLLFIIPLNIAAMYFGQVAVYEQNFGLFTSVCALNISLGFSIVIFHTLANEKARQFVVKCWSKINHR